MTNRLLVALCVVLGFIGPASAQAPDGLPMTPPIHVGEEPFAAPCCDGPSGRAPDNWVTADFFLAWMTGVRLPPLLTTSPVGTPAGSIGVLPATPNAVGPIPTNNTTILIGNEWVNQGTRAGFRAAAGYRFCPEMCMSVEGGLSFIEGRATDFTQGSDGSVLLARPFINATTGVNAAVVIADPDNAAATFHARASSGSFYEAHLDVSETLWDDATCRVEPMLGYRFYRYDETFRTQQVRTFLPGSVEGEGTVVTLDDFTTRNTFNGPELGVRVWFGNADLALELLGKVAIGNLRREVNIKGTTTTVVPGIDPIVVPQGFFALASNSGIQVRNDWASLGELGATLHWRLSHSLRLRVGYTALMLDGVARATEHVNLRINRGQLVAGDALPNPDTHAKDLWIQTLNLGLEYSF